MISYSSNGRVLLTGVALGVTMLGLSGVRANAGVGYTLDVTTHYQFGAPLGSIGPAGNPDTGFVIVTNNGASTFMGDIILDGTSPSTGHLTTTDSGATLAPGQSVILSINDESSNQGGWNKVGGGSPDNGVQLMLNGSIMLGAGSEAVALSVFDKDIHSGVPRDPFGDFPTDAYVIQGGDAFGRDTGDNFEVAQADGHFQFFEPNSVPEPSTLALLGGFAGAGLLALRRRKA